MTTGNDVNRIVKGLLTTSRDAGITAVISAVSARSIPGAENLDVQALASVFRSAFDACADNGMRTVSKTIERALADNRSESDSKKNA